MRKELYPFSALLQDIKVDIEPKLSTADALTVVKTDLAPRFDYAYKPVVELVVYPKGVSRVLPRKALVADNKLNAEDFITEVKSYQLAYYIHTELENPGDTRHTDYLVNAQTGAIIEKWDSLLTSAATGTGKGQYNGAGAVSLNTNSVASGFELRDLTRPVSGGNVVTISIIPLLEPEPSTRIPTITGGTAATSRKIPNPPLLQTGRPHRLTRLTGYRQPGTCTKTSSGVTVLMGSVPRPMPVCTTTMPMIMPSIQINACVFTYGDGTKLQTLTSLDVAAHEFSHGVCMTSAGLIYNKESGGLNEANSDIMGAMAEGTMRGANGKGSVIPDTGGTWTQGNRSPPQLIHSKCVSCISPARTSKVPTRGAPHCKT